MKAQKLNRHELESVFLSEDTSGFLQFSNKDILNKPHCKNEVIKFDLSIYKSDHDDSAINNLGLDQIDYYLDELQNNESS